MSVSHAQLKVLREMGQRRNALVNGDEAKHPYWIDGGGSVRKNVAEALIRKGYVELTGKEGGQPGILLFTATTKGRVAAFII